MTASGIILGVFAFLGFIAAGAFLIFLVHTCSERRLHRKAYEAALRAFEARPRGKVVKIGTIIVDQLGREHPWGFEVDCEGRVPGMSVGIHGEVLIAGYAREELVEMVKRRAEFE